MCGLPKWCVVLLHRPCLRVSSYPFSVADYMRVWCQCVLQHRPPMNNYFRQQVFYLVEKPAFEMFILTCILANTVIMAMLYFGQPDDYGDFLEFMNLTFAAIFMLEAGLKVLGLGVRQYFMGTCEREALRRTPSTNDQVLVHPRQIHGTCSTSRLLSAHWSAWC